MRSQADECDRTTILPLFSVPLTMQSPEHPGMLTPPLHATAAVPFRWEEQPGKPHPCTDLIALPASGRPNCLEPPPRLYLEYSSSSSCKKKHVNRDRRSYYDSAKSPLPTTVLDGPYITGRPQFSSSLKFFVDSESPERGELRTLVLGDKMKMKMKKKRNWWVNFSGGGDNKNNREIFPSYSSDENGGNSSVKMMTRSGSFSSLSPAKSHFWATIYQGVKQVMPWKCKRSKKDGFVV